MFPNLPKQKKMASSKHTVPYAPLLCDSDHPQPQTQNVVVHSLLRQCLLFSGAVLLLLSAAAFFLYPSEPKLHLARLHLNSIHVHSSPKPSLDLSFSLTVNVRNTDFFSLDYDSLAVSVGYRGKQLGLVTSHGGRVRARASSSVNATLDLHGLQVVHHVFHFIKDLATGIVPFDTDSAVNGELGFWFFQIPLKAKVSCEVYINTKNHTIVRQDCYSK